MGKAVPAEISPIGENVKAMTKAEARRCAEAIRAHLDGARALVLELYERRGWAALGYGSWRECVVTEFDQSKSHLYRQLEAARIEREISPIGEIGTIPEGRLRPLAAVPEGDRKAAWDLAVEAAPNGQPTARHVAEVVEAIAPKPRKGQGVSPPSANGHAPSRPLSAGPKISPIGEKSTPDLGPSAVDEALASGAEPDPEGDAEADPEREAIQSEPLGQATPEAIRVDDDRSDGDWLETLPVRSKLSPNCRNVFDRDALKYRRVTGHKAFRAFAGMAKQVLEERKVGVTGFYHGKVSSFLRTPHPRDWVACRTCDGRGIVGSIGNCDKCFARGYLIV